MDSNGKDAGRQQAYFQILRSCLKIKRYGMRISHDPIYNVYIRMKLE